MRAKRFISIGIMILAIAMINCKSEGADVQKLPVFLYHHILPEADNKNFLDNGCVISLELFQEQMKYLSDNGFHTVTINELYDFLYNKKDLPEKSVMLTFDDGYLSNYQFAYPVLKEYGLTACIFMITGFIQPENQEYDPDILQYMSREQMELSKDVLEFESHTHMLHALDPADQSILVTTEPGAVRVDLLNSTERLGRNTAFAYPYGQYTDETIQCVKDMSFSMAFNIKNGYVTKNSNPFELRRFTVYPSYSLDVFKNVVSLNASY